MDAIATESQFLDHLAPVWTALHPPERGRFLVHPLLLERAAGKGIAAEVVDVAALMQATPIAPKPVLEEGPLALVAAAGDIKIGRRLSYRSFAFLEHGAGQSYGGRRHDANHGSYPGGPDREDVGLFMVPNEPAAQRWRDAYPKARVEVVGCPKLDGLPARGPGPGPTVALSWHWPAPLAISGYAGTAIGDFLAQLPRVAERFTTIGHAHPKGDWPARMARQYARIGVPYIADFEDVCRAADVFVADNTSCLPEFASTGRPVVLLNARYWSRKHSVGGRFWDWAHLGINVGPDDDLPAAIEEALADSPERQAAREDALSLVYAYRHGAAQRAATAVRTWLGARQDVAA